jgi:hypothetical protein
MSWLDIVELSEQTKLDISNISCYKNYTKEELKTLEKPLFDSNEDK